MRLLTWIFAVVAAVFSSLQLTPKGFAQTPPGVKFTCKVEKTKDSKTFISMGRQVMCPLTVSYVDAASGGSINRSGVCAIPPSGTTCGGEILDIPPDIARKDLSFSTARTLLVDEEVRMGAVAVSDKVPSVENQSDIIVVTHQYAFPLPVNPYHNRNKPCDINKDGFVSPLDALTLAQFLNRNNFKVNLAAFDPKGRPTAFWDINDDWSVDNFDYLKLMTCLNSR